MVQAQTEIDLLNLILNRDVNDEHNIVRIIHKFVYRNHQCLVFEMLSYNLYELLKNTRFKGVSLNLIRKFAKQIIRSLEFLARPDVDIIHCDLKPENILLRHPRRSAIKLIDLGSSCLRLKRTYSYIQSRFYRAPEILLGLPYDQKIDIWSLGCVLVELHTGEPLFGGTDQADQLYRIVEVLGMPPVDMLQSASPELRAQFFDFVDLSPSAPPDLPPEMMAFLPDGSGYFTLRRPSAAPPYRHRALVDILGVTQGGPSGRRRGEPGHSPDRYLEFVHFIQQMLVYSPSARRSASQVAGHPYLHPHLLSDPGMPSSAWDSAAPGSPAHDAGTAIQRLSMNSGPEDHGDDSNSLLSATQRGWNKYQQPAVAPKLRSRSAPSTAAAVRAKKRDAQSPALAADSPPQERSGKGV